MFFCYLSLTKEKFQYSSKKAIGISFNTNIQFGSNNFPNLYVLFLFFSPDWCEFVPSTLKYIWKI